MHRALLALAASSLAIIGFSLGAGPLSGATPAPADETRVSGPIVHENLAIYLIHGKSDDATDARSAMRAIKAWHEAEPTSKMWTTTTKESAKGGGQ